MLLAIDARTIYQSNRRGTGKNLIDLYRHLGEVRPDWRILAFHRQPGNMPALLPARTVEPSFIEMPGDRFDAWERFRLPMAAWRAGATVLHCPANTCPGWLPLPAIVTIHDLIPLDMPAGHPPAMVRRFERSVRTACRRAAVIICPSLYTRRRLIEEFDGDPTRIIVNPWAPDSSVTLMKPEAWEPVARRYGIEGQTVLHFGAADPRKNTNGVIEAWARLPARLRSGWKLVIVGLDPGMLARTTDLIQSRALEGSVRLHGFAAEEDLPALLNAAEVLAFPSLSEGFGLPILDAWATRTAVLTSDRTSLPEVAGDGALLVNPTDTDAIAQGLAQLMDNPTLRAALISCGRRLLGRLTWRDTAERFARAVELACGVHQLRRAAA